MRERQLLVRDGRLTDSHDIIETWVSRDGGVNWDRDTVEVRDRSGEGDVVDMARPILVGNSWCSLPLLAHGMSTPIDFADALYFADRYGMELKTTGKRWLVTLVKEHSVR